MASKKKQSRKNTSAPGNEQVAFNLKPGTQVRVTIEAGALKEGKVPVKILVDQVGEAESGKKNLPFMRALRPGDRFAAVLGRMTSCPLETWLFLLALIIYLGTRLIGLTHFPIYFFTDEAIQTQSIVELVANKYRDTHGVLFPTYFRNGEYANLSLSVYLQWIPLILFGKSAFVTRAVSVWITLIAPLSTGLILRDVFKNKYWWAGPLFLSITPGWFLHSRTAFETAEFTAFFAGTLCAYLLYRYKSPRYLYLAFLLAAFAFYTYSPGQLIVPCMALALLFSDWRHHWENRRTVLKGLALLVILALPYFRFRIEYPGAAFSHLHTLGSYLLKDIPLSARIIHYFSEYGVGLSTWYWYIPNDRDLQRHLMKGYGNIMLVTLPFAILGLARVLSYLRESANRTVLIALLVSPVAAALVQTGITRALIFVVPAAILTVLGLEEVFHWVDHPNERLTDVRHSLVQASRRTLTALLILLAGATAGYFAREKTDRIAGVALAAVLVMQMAGVKERLMHPLRSSSLITRWNRWSPSRTVPALAVFIILSTTNIYMLGDALRRGPTWFTNYGLGGMQYGAFQIFDVIKQYKQAHPETRIVLSPDWANGTDVVARFFLNDPFAIEFGSLQGYLTRRFPLGDNTLFILTPEEYALATKSEKLTDIHVERILPYPDGRPGFYFIRMRYVDNIDEIFAAEKAFRDILQESRVSIDGQEVKVRYSYLDTDSQSEAIKAAFDHDPLSLTKTFEANPYIIELTFPSPRIINGFSIVIGAAQAHLTLKCFPSADAQPVIYTFDGRGSLQQPELSFDLPQPTQVQVLQVELLDPLSAALAQIHVWELTLR